MDSSLRFVLCVAGKPFWGCSIPIYHGTYIQVQPLSRSASCPRSCKDQWIFTLEFPITQQSEQQQQGKNWLSFYRQMGKPCRAHSVAADCLLCSHPDNEKQHTACVKAGSNSWSWNREAEKGRGICANRNCSAGYRGCIYLAINVRHQKQLHISPYMKKIDAWERLKFVLEKKSLKISISISKCLNYSFLPYFSPFTCHSTPLCSSLVTQCHIDFLIAEAALSFHFSYNPLFACVSFLFRSHIIWYNFSRLRATSTYCSLSSALILQWAVRDPAGDLSSAL